MRKLLLFSLCLVGVFSIPLTSQAIMITNVTTGTVLFYDNFENVDPVSTAVAPDPTDDYNAIPTVGSYQWLEWDPAIGQVTSYSDGTPAGPGAAQGDNYLRVHNISGHEFQADLDTAPSTGDHINIALMAYLPSESGQYMVFKARDGGLGVVGAQVAGARAGANGVVEDLDGADSGLTYQYDTWQEWEFDYVIDSPTYTMTVGGVTSAPISNAPRGGPGTIQGFGFWNGGVANTSFYLDDAEWTPPPSVPGDTDGDGDVDGDDAAVLAGNWLQTVEGGCSVGDFDEDGDVDDLDATILAANWTKSTAAGAAVPEPTMAAILLNCLVALLVYRRRS